MERNKTTTVACRSFSVRGVVRTLSLFLDEPHNHSLLQAIHDRGDLPHSFWTRGLTLMCLLHHVEARGVVT
jgi:hypothetical protein